MRKLTIESLQVQSFATSAVTHSARGTVRAHADSEAATCTCWPSRNGDCASWGCIETGYPCNLITGPVASCLC